MPTIGEDFTLYGQGIMSHAFMGCIFKPTGYDRSLPADEDDLM